MEDKFLDSAIALCPECNVEVAVKNIFGDGGRLVSHDISGGGECSGSKQLVKNVTTRREVLLKSAGWRRPDLYHKRGNPICAKCSNLDYWHSPIVGEILDATAETETEYLVEAEERGQYTVASIDKADAMPSPESYAVITAKLNGDELAGKTFDNLPAAARSMQERLYCPSAHPADEHTGEVLWMVVDGVEEHKVGYIEDALATVACDCGGEIASRLQADGLINECANCGKVVE